MRDFLVELQKLMEEYDITLETANGIVVMDNEMNVYVEETTLDPRHLDKYIDNIKEG